MYAPTAAAPPGVQSKFRCDLQDTVGAVPSGDLLVSSMLGLESWILMKRVGGVWWSNMAWVKGMRRERSCCSFVL